jgi:hypothetical protein
MSSLNSPPLNLELSAPDLQAYIAWVAVLLAVSVPFIFLQSSAGALLGALSGTLVYWGLCSAHWLGRAGRVTRVTWFSDGRWTVQDPSGDVSECELHRTSRTFSKAVWLCLCPVNARWRRIYVLATPSSVPSPQLRRLILRLRVDRPIDSQGRVEPA